MTDIITQILVEVLKIFGIATKEMKRGSASKFWRIGCVYGSSLNYRIEKFLRKLAGMSDLEDALKKLDRLTQEEARMSNAEVLRLAQSIHDGVENVDGKVEEVGDKVGDVGDKVQCVDDKVQVVIDGALALFCQLKTFLRYIISDGKQARVAAKEISDKVSDVGVKVERVDDKVQVVIDGARGLSGRLSNHSNI